MSRVLPVLFNTEMVQAILREVNPKTATRRAVKYKYSNTEMKMRTDKYGTRLIEIQKDIEGETHGKNPDGTSWHKVLPYIEKKPPCKRGDILYIRETWGVMSAKRFDACVDIAFKAGGENKRIFFSNSGTDSINRDEYDEFIKKWYKTSTLSWHPSIHMPKEAARIWLRVKDVRVERLWDMTLDDFLSEGIVLRPEAFNDPGNAYMQAKSEFARIWDSTIRKSQTNLNPWVWVIEFERCERPAPCILSGIEPADDEVPCIGYGRAEKDDEKCEMCKKCLICSAYEEE